MNIFWGVANVLSFFIWVGHIIDRWQSLDATIGGAFILSALFSLRCAIDSFAETVR